MDGQRYEAETLTLETREETDNNTTTCRWRIGTMPLRLITAWQVDPATDIVSRRDLLTNTGTIPVTISRCLARVAFPPGGYDCYAPCLALHVANH